MVDEYRSKKAVISRYLGMFSLDGAHNAVTVGSQVLCYFPLSWDVLIRLRRLMTYGRVKCYFPLSWDVLIR